MRATDALQKLGVTTYLPSKATRIGYLFWLSRPRFWPYLAGPVVVGAVYAADSFDVLLQPTILALFAYFLVPANIFLYGVNDIYDTTVDEYNEKKHGPEVRYERQPSVIGLTVVCALPLVVFAFVLPHAAGALVGFLVLATEYSAPPLRFKTLPVVDSVSNGLYILPGVAAYTAINGVYPPTAAIIGGWFWTMGMHAFSAIPDIEPDRTARIETIATALGEHRTYAYCGACWLSAALVFGGVHPFFSAVLLVYPLLVLTIVWLSIDAPDAYWWFPLINTVVGMVITLGGVWTIVGGGRV